MNQPMYGRSRTFSPEKTASISVYSTLFCLSLFLFSLAAVFSTAVPLAAQQTGQTKADAKEFVEEVSVEMIVRALRDGKPVGGMTESDFILKENKSDGAGTKEI